MADNRSKPDPIKEIHNGLFRTLVNEHIGNVETADKYVNWKTHFASYIEGNVQKGYPILSNFHYLEDNNIISPGKYDVLLRIFSKDTEAIRKIEEAASQIEQLKVSPNPGRQDRTPIQCEDPNTVYGNNTAPLSQRATSQPRETQATTTKVADPSAGQPKENQATNEDDSISV